MANYPRNHAKRSRFYSKLCLHRNSIANKISYRCLLDSDERISTEKRSFQWILTSIFSITVHWIIFYSTEIVIPMVSPIISRKRTMNRSIFSTIWTRRRQWIRFVSVGNRILNKQFKFLLPVTLKVAHRTAWTSPWKSKSSFRFLQLFA